MIEYTREDMGVLQPNLLRIATILGYAYEQGIRAHEKGQSISKAMQYYLIEYYKRNDSDFARYTLNRILWILFEAPLEDLPLLINERDDDEYPRICNNIIAPIARWRLRIGK